MPEDGKTEMVITNEGGKVVQRFQRPMPWVLYDPQAAVNVAQALAKEAYIVQTGKSPTVVNRAAAPGLADQVRGRLLVSCSLMIASMMKDGRNADTIALNVVDHVLTRAT